MAGPMLSHISSDGKKGDRLLTVIFEEWNENVLYRGAWRDTDMDGKVGKNDLFSYVPSYLSGEKWRLISGGEIGRYNRFLSGEVMKWDANVGSISVVDCGIDGGGNRFILLSDGVTRCFEINGVFSFQRPFPHLPYLREFASVTPESPDWQLVHSAFEMCR